MDCLVIGAGLSGSVAARYMAEHGKHVVIWERRNHIGGNMYDYVDEHHCLVQKYGPHTFHTKSKELYDYICRFEQWQDYKSTCGAIWDGKYTPVPFNFKTIDLFYPEEKARSLKSKLQTAFAGRDTATVLEVLRHPDQDIRNYAEFLFKNDYAPYTAKQWGISADEIDPSVLERVPLRFSYKDGYFDDPYQILPVHSYTTFFQNLLDHKNIEVMLGMDASNRLKVTGDRLFLNGSALHTPVVYTGALDELFACVYGQLPYRSLRFEWKYSEIESLQSAPIVAYPQADGYTRITEYKKLPVQDVRGTSYAVEYPVPYRQGEKAEPYYPILTSKSQRQYEEYLMLAERVPNLILCGRLADFKYYNMDQALEHVLSICREKLSKF